MTRMRVALAQLRDAVGDIKGNAERVAEAMTWAEREGADVLVLPELVLTGYAVEDLVLHREFVAEAEEATARLAEHSGATVTILSTVASVPPRRSWDSIDRSVSISAAILCDGEQRGVYHKVLLPTHGGYDEGKNFAPGATPDALWRIGDVVSGVCICEDLWSGDGPPEAQAAAGARVLLAPNASPWHRTKVTGRERLATRVARRNGVPLVYVNLVGGHDELVFDGGSLVIDGRGEILHRAASFAEDRAVLDVPLAASRAITRPVRTVHTRPLPERAPLPAPVSAEVGDDLTQVWRAIVLGTRDFARKNGYRHAVLGLSGGIDAALTATAAADALGPECVLGVAMPAPSTPEHERRDAEALAAELGIDFAVVPIGPSLDALGAAVRRRVDGASAATTEGLEARTRATIVAALGDEQHRLVLATGNKTELSIGTLKGDVAGGFAPLKDCPKTLLFALAEHVGAAGGRVPARIPGKQTTAERSAVDLPSYEVLDRIVERVIEQGEGVEDLVAEGLPEAAVLSVLHRIDDAEIVRRQSPPGVKISPRAFGTDRQMPISNAWRVYRREDTSASTPANPRLRMEPEAALDEAPDALPSGD